MIPTDPDDPTPRIRRVESSNISDLIRIAEDRNLSHWSAQSYLDEMKRTDSILLRLVSDDNSTIGFVVGRMVAGVSEDEVDAEIYNIAVVEAEEGIGLGRLMLDKFVSICRKKRVSNIWLEVRESNANAIAFYRRNGFVAVQTRTHFYDNPREHAILMKLILKN